MKPENLITFGAALCCALIFEAYAVWLISAFLGLYSAGMAGIGIGVGCLGVFVLIPVYSKIRNKYWID